MKVMISQVGFMKQMSVYPNGYIERAGFVSDIYGPGFSF